MILCVNPNAAIDKTLVVRGYRLNQIHRPEQVVSTPGGKGCNVARGLKCLGESPVVTGWVGGFAGQFIEAGLQKEGIGTDFVHTDAESRTCISVFDPENGALTEIYEKGDPVPPGKVAEFVTRFSEIIRGYQAVTFSGSLPPGVPVDLYGRLIEIAREAGVPSYLDSSGEALSIGLDARPALIKPNEDEMASLTGRKMQALPDYVSAALDISRRYRTGVAVSLGAQGVLAVRENEVLHVRPPNLTVKSVVGSGDCTLAGIVFGDVHAFSFEDSVKYGVAAGSANALTFGAGVFNRAEFEQVLAQVSVSRL